LGGSIWAASRMESIFVVLTKSSVIRATSRCQITNSPPAVCWLPFAVCAPCSPDRWPLTSGSLVTRHPPLVTTAPP
jgi:hypothetical protein